MEERKTILNLFTKLLLILYLSNILHKTAPSMVCWTYLYAAHLIRVVWVKSNAEWSGLSYRKLALSFKRPG